MNRTYKNFRESTKLTKIWNRIIEWEGLTLATVMWHENSWKLIDKNATWEEVKDRQYKPIAEFYTQEQLWKYIHTQV